MSLVYILIYKEEGIKKKVSEKQNMTFEH